MVEATRCAIVTASTTDPRFWLGLSDAVITVVKVGHAHGHGADKSSPVHVQRSNITD